MIIKKFIFDFLKLMDEYRKEKRRKDFSDSDDDDDPFHNKSTGFNFSGVGRKNLNATPTSVKADSIAGRSRASAQKSVATGAGGPINIQAGGRGGQAAVPEAAKEFTEYLGENVPEYHAKLKELWSRRTALMQVKKGKKKKKKRRAGGLRRRDGDASEAGETATVYDDDKTSFMTMNAADAKQQEDFLVSLIDDIKIQPNPREFKGHLPIIETLGITNYDKVS